MASHYARLGSGSACRSIFGGTVVWGESNGQLSNNEYAAAVKGVADIFHSMRDSVLIISSKEKACFFNRWSCINGSTSI